MSGDYTRFTFEPRRRFVAVDMQQGRVQLDSDWNEQADLQRERTRLLSMDVRSAAWVPAVTTPDAFLVGVLPGGNLSLQPGRIYVDGRLAEIFEGEGVTYLNQPFLPVPPSLNPAIDTIVYLDLWEREVTWAEMPALLDVALGGIDTTTRIQQVWQVKRHEQQGLNDCGVDLNALFPASAGRLTTSANAPPAPDDPCILPPNAGYRGIENRLYRVEVQTGGALGTAKFKWSRDNGSIVSRVSGLAVAGGQTRLTVNRVGRDATLRFRINDWVTLTDDHRELNGEAGQMARVIDIDEAARVVVLDRAVPTAGRAFGAGADIAARNTRLQRWDESAPLNVLDADGLMTTGAGPIGLEDGVEVAFSMAAPGGVFRVGDYWVFAARTADASVEILTAAPPRGIRHQYLQLAAIPAGGVPTDCRPPNLDDAGCCTFVVRPGENIQAAIDALPPAGGCICLKAGEHFIETPLLLQRDNVTIHGESLGAVVINRRGTGVLVVAGTRLDRVHSLVLQQAERSNVPIVVVEGCDDLGFEDCRFETQDGGDTVGVFAVASEQLAIRHCGFEALALAVWLEKGCRDVTVADCDFRMAKPNPNNPDSAAILAHEMRGAIYADGNTIRGAINGIIIDDDVGGMPRSRARGSRVAGNHVAMVFLETPTRRFGIDAAAESMLVSDNHITHEGGGRLAAIRMCGNGSTATGNRVVSSAEVSGAAVAIAVGHEAASKFLPLERVIVADNIVEGRQHGIINAGAARCAISGNLLGREGDGMGFGIVCNTATECEIAGNQINRAGFAILCGDGARNAVRGNVITSGNAGIVASKDAALTVADNRLTGLRNIGILVSQITERCEIVANRLTRCSSESDLAMGIAAVVVLGELHIESNEVMDTGIAPEAGGPVSPRAVGITGFLVLEARVTGNLVTYSQPDLRLPTNEDRALLMMGMLDYEILLGAGRAVFGFPIQVSDNKFIGTGASALVELVQVPISDTISIRFERVLFSGNYCSHMSPAFSDNLRGATVSLVGRMCTVSGNQVKATTPFFRSWHLHNMGGPFIGNVSHERGWDRLPTAGFPAPEQNFNSIA